MNENLERLMKLSDYAAPHLAGRAHKLADLIVRECVTIIETAVDHREPASTYAEKIKQHFGMEK